MARLVMQREGRTKEYELGNETILGRKSSCIIRVPSPRCSREHCRILKGSGGFFLEDLKSSNGTFIGDKKIGRQLLKNGDEITLGGITYLFQDKTDDPLVGKRLGKYHIIDKVGVGGMGVVYRASQITLGREVALKVMSRRLATKASFIQSFEREAKIAARLQHPNIIGIHDFGHEGEWYFFSMEFVEGENLLDMALRQGGLSIEECLEYGRQLSDALDHAHNQGILHKDIKPQNVMINNENHVKLADMGLASISDEDSQDEQEDTERGSFMATPQYVAPEVIRRQEPDARSDLYSLAATLYHMLTSKPPFSGTDVKDLLKKHLSAPVPDPRTLRAEIPEGLALLVMKGLAKDPADRPQTAHEFATGLAAILQQVNKPQMAPEKKKHVKSAVAAAALNRPSTTQIPLSSSRGDAKPARNRRIYLAVGGGVLLLLLIVLPLVLRGNPQRQASALLREAQASYVDGDDVTARAKLEEILRDYPDTIAAGEAKKMREAYQGTRAQQELLRVRSEVESGRSDNKKAVKQLRLFLQQQSKTSPEDLKAIQEYISFLGGDPDLRSDWEKRCDDLVLAGKLLDARGLAHKVFLDSKSDSERARAAQVKNAVQEKLDVQAQELFKQAQALVGKKQFSKAAEAFSRVVLDFPETNWQIPAAHELANLYDSSSRLFGEAWSRLLQRIATNDLPGAREVAFLDEGALAKTALSKRGRTLELYVESQERFCKELLATAKKKTADPSAQVRVLIDGKERMVQLEAEKGVLYAIGQHNRKAIEISDIVPTDLARLMPGRKISPEQTLGGAVFFAAHKAPALALEYARMLEIASGELAMAGRDLRLLLDGQAPLASFADILDAEAVCQNSRVLNNRSIIFYGPGRFSSARFAVRLPDLRLSAHLSDRCVLEAFSADGSLFALTRKEEQLLVRVGAKTQGLPYPRDGFSLAVDGSTVYLRKDGKDFGSFGIASAGAGSALLQLSASGAAEVTLLELGIANPPVSAEEKSTAPESQ